MSLRDLTPDRKSHPERPRPEAHAPERRDHRVAAAPVRL